MSNRNREIFDNLNKSIEDLEGLHKVHGHDIHSDKWKRCVEHVKAKGGTDNPYAVCTSVLGQNSFKSFDGDGDLSVQEITAINIHLLEKAVGGLRGLQGEPGEEVEEASEITLKDPSASEITPEGEGIEKSYVTPTIEMLYGQSPLPRPSMVYDPASFMKNKEPF